MNYLTNYYKNLSEQLQEKYNALLNEAGGNMTAYWGGGLGGALGQGSWANQFADHIENSGIYLNLNQASTYGTNAQLANNLENFPPQGSNPGNIMNNKGWTRKDNGLGGYTYFSPGGWEWSYSGGRWYLRPNNPFGDSGNSNSTQPPTPTVPMGNRTQTLRAFSPVKRRK
jgi:hypothetical protein